MTGSTNIWVAWACFIVAIALVAWGWRDYVDWFDRWRWIPLPEAAVEAYAVLGGTLLATGADEHLHHNRLNWVGQYLAESVPLRGRIPPQRRRLMIGRELVQQGSIVEGAKALKFSGEATPYAVELCVRRGELRRLLKETKDAKVR